MNLIPGSGKYPGGGNGNPPQYSSLGNPKNRGIWKGTVHRVTKGSVMTEPLNSDVFLYIPPFKGFLIFFNFFNALLFTYLLLLLDLCSLRAKAVCLFLKELISSISPPPLVRCSILSKSSAYAIWLMSDLLKSPPYKILHPWNIKIFIIYVTSVFKKYEAALKYTYGNIYHQPKTR